MKRLPFLLLIFLAVQAKSQEIIEHKVDEFTGDTVTATSWEVLNRASLGNSLQCFVRLRQVNGHNYIYFRINKGGSVFAVEEGENIMLKLSDSSIVKLNNMEYAITNYGGGAVGLGGSRSMGLQLKATLSEADTKRLASMPVQKFRYYTTEGYYETEIKEKFADKLISLSRLIQNSQSKSKTSD